MPAESGFLAWIDVRRLFADEAELKRFFTAATFPVLSAAILWPMVKVSSG